MSGRKLFLIPFLSGAVVLGNVIRKPRFTTLYTVDVLELLAAGMLFGIALVAMLGRLKLRSKP
jgi:hypothetical protein